MARDPFAPVPQSSMPQWVWIVVGVVALMVVGVGTTMAIVLSKRPPPVVATPAVPAGQPAVTPPATGTSPATTQVAANDPQAGATDSKPDKGEKGDKPEKKKHHSGGSSHATKAEPKASGPAAPPPPPKKQNNMSQKDIDKLLGI